MIRHLSKEELEAGFDEDLVGDIAEKL